MIHKEHYTHTHISLEIIFKTTLAYSITNIKVWLQTSLELSYSNSPTHDMGLKKIINV